MEKWGAKGSTKRMIKRSTLERLLFIRDPTRFYPCHLVSTLGEYKRSKKLVWLKKYSIEDLC
jgi:hypothetical protein